MENNKKILIGLSLLAVAGVGFYFWKKNKDKDDALKSIQTKLNVNPNPNSQPTIPVGETNTAKMNAEFKSFFTGDVIAHKCSCTGKQLPVNADKETMDKFHASCIKNGGMIIDIKSK